MFCGQANHFMRDCPLVNEYIAKGWCARDQYNRVVDLQGRMLHSQGRPIAEDIAEAHAPTQGPTRSANLLEIASDPIPEAHDESVETFQASIDAIQRQLEILQTQQKPRGPPKPRGKQVVVEVPPPPTAPGSAPVAVGPPGRQQHVVPSNPKAFEPAKTKAGDDGRQYKYTTPIEKPEAAGDVTQLLLDTPVPMTVGRIMAIAPDVRKQIKDMTTTRRLPIAGSHFLEQFFTEAVVSEEEIKEHWIGAESYPLRQIPGTINNIEATCVLDSGAQFIAMRQDVWMRTGKSLSPDKSFTMEAANNTKSDTLGLVDYVTINFSGLDIHLRVQVVKEAPYELLLGRPFFVLTAATTVDFRNSDQHLTLNCPRTGDRVTLPTEPRLRSDPVAHPHKGFP